MGEALHIGFVHADFAQLACGVFGAAPHGQGLCLCLHVQQDHAVVLGGKGQGAALGAQANEIHRHQMLALVNELKVSVLAVDP